jgi:hypothetical protein
MHYVSGQEIMAFTADAYGKPGPFLNKITNQPVSPTGVVFKFRLEATPGQGITNTVNFGTPLNFDPYNPAIVIQQDPTTLGYWVLLVTTGFLDGLVVHSVDLRTQWSSTDPSNPAASQSHLDTVWLSDL